VTTLTTRDSGPPPPTGFQLGNPPRYYELTTTATYTGQISVCINYTGVSYTDPASLRLFHYEGGSWADRTVSLNTTTNTICASVTSLSPFAIFERVDTTPPTITITSPASGAFFVLNQAVASDYTCADASGVASCTGPVPTGSNIDTASVGAKTFTVTAVDRAGNAASVTRTYTVGYAFTGFFRPVDNPPTLNSVKAGSAVPVKFSLSGNMGLNILAAGYPASGVTVCDATAPVTELEETATAGSSSLTYDASSDQYMYVWKTSSTWANTCRQLVVGLIDGTYHRANFKFK